MLRQIAAAPTTSGTMCGLAISDSSAWCWGGSRTAARIANSPSLLAIGGILGGEVGGGCGLMVDSTTWCWGAQFSGPAGGGDSVQFVELAVSSAIGCGRTAAGTVWCWKEFPQQPTQPRPMATVDGITSLATEHGIVLGLRLGRVIRWDSDGEATWSILPVPTLANAVVQELQPNLAYCVRQDDGAVWCDGEHVTNASGYYNDQYLPLQPVDP